nr:EAL domain-containing protein [Neokomagataea anthophila]
MDDIRRAVDQHEFQLVYQPIIHAQTGFVVGYEALSRWSGAVHGAVSIQKVIALIEENGQSETFDYWVLETACKQAAGWPKGTWVAVNMAAMHFSVPGVAERILDIVHHAGIDPSRLQLEVTETFALDVGPQVAHALALLDEAGIKLAMDDFGAGYSSMNYLRLYPFSKIKLDASLVQDVLYNPKSKGILRSAVELSVDLGLSLTAEGVSSPEHYRFLREAGCTDLQGFYLGRPVPAEHLVWGHVMGQEYLG